MRLRLATAVLLMILGPIPAVAQTAAAAGPVDTSSVATAPVNSSYQLGNGDKVQVTVYGEPDLSGEFAVNGQGSVSLPLIGDVTASGLTLPQFSQSVEDHFKAGYLVNPKVSVEVTSFRPYYIMGEVDKVGEYPYTDGLNVINAIARAEGFTYRAQQKRVYIKHYGQTAEVEVPLTDNLLVQPGDTIRIAERHW